MTTSAQGSTSTSPDTRPAAVDPASQPTVPAAEVAHVLVHLELLVRPGEEDEAARAVRDRVGSVAGSAMLGPVAWSDVRDGEDLVRQWDVEQHGAPLDGRRVRSLTMPVHGDHITDRVDEVAWAAIDAICPTAREEERRLDAGETPVPATPDRYPWSSGTHVVEAGDVRDGSR